MLAEGSRAFSLPWVQLPYGSNPALSLESHRLCSHLHRIQSLLRFGVSGVKDKAVKKAKGGSLLSQLIVSPLLLVIPFSSFLRGSSSLHKTTSIKLGR